MAIVKIELNNQNKKPTIEYNTALGGVSTLIDTGANIPIYFGSESAFKLDFPNASLSNYITFVSGLGGTNKSPCPIYEIPDFVLKDSYDGQNSFTIHNMYIAIYDAPVNFGFTLLLGATVFSRVNYSFMNRLAKPYMKIDYKRDVYGTIEACLDDSGHMYVINGKVVVDYMKTFFQKTNNNSMGIMDNKLQEKNYKKEFQKLYKDKIGRASHK